MRLSFIEGEQVLVRTRAKASAVLVPALLRLLVLLLVSFALTGWLVSANRAASLGTSGVTGANSARFFLPPDALPWLNLGVVLVQIILALLLLRFCIVPVVRWMRRKTVLTNRRLILVKPRGKSAVRQIPLELISWVNSRANPWQKLHGCGTLECQMASGASLKLTSIPSAGVFEHYLLGAMGQAGAAHAGHVGEEYL